jgi:hypothetical protein
VGAELFHAGGRADMTKLLVAFRNFENGRKKTYFCYGKGLNMKVVSVGDIDKFWSWSMETTFSSELASWQRNRF